MLSLAYAPRDELPRPMQREVASAGWEVAAADAYPVLMPFFTPGGGLSRDRVRRLTAILRALASFADEHGSQLREGSSPFRWSSDELVLWYEGDGSDSPSLQDLPPHLQGIEEMLRSSELQTMDELQGWVGKQTEGYNETPQSELSGLSPAQAHALLEGDWKGGGPLRLAERVRHAHKAINEADVWGLHVLRVVRVVLHVAGPLRRRKGRFKVTRDGRRLVKEPNVSALLAHVFRAYFREFNLSYLDRDAEATELQYVVPLLLWRIGAEARDWVDSEALAEQVLPDSLRTDPEDPPMISNGGVSRCQRRVVEPLVRFGLLDERALSANTEKWWRRRVEVRIAPLVDQFLTFHWE